MAETKGEPELRMIMEYRGGPHTDPESYVLYACRGVRKGCKKRVHKLKRHCEDCLLPDPDDTLEQVVKMLERGNA